MGIENSEAGLPSITQQVAQHARSPSGDDTGNNRMGDEPAMAGMPPVRSPSRKADQGRSPVDPGESPQGRRTDGQTASPPALRARLRHWSRVRHRHAGAAANACSSIVATLLDPARKDREDNSFSLRGSGHSAKDWQANSELPLGKHHKDWNANPCSKYLINIRFLTCESRSAMAGSLGCGRGRPGRPRSRTQVIA